MAEPTKRIDIKEFRDLGYLQEANRQFFHPLGLALEVVIEEDGSERLGGVWDYRDDPEGIYFVPSTIESEKVATVFAQAESKSAVRLKLFGESDNASRIPSVVQPQPEAGVVGDDWDGEKDVKGKDNQRTE